MYLQTGGHELLHDMIVDFARVAEEQGAKITLDVWENMNHDFHAYGDLIAESREAYAHIRRVVNQHCELPEEVSILPRSARAPGGRRVESPGTRLAGARSYAGGNR
jgi:hypothetical protein